MWRQLFRPELLFAVAVLQALGPYLMWANGLGVANAQHDFHLNYIPLLIWFIGYVSFLAGSLLASGRAPSVAQYTLRGSEVRIQWITAAVVVLLILQLLWLVKLYGTLPLFSYMRQDHQIDITKAVQLQDTFAVGQVGAMYLTLFLLNALLLIQFIINLETGKKAWVLIVISLCVMLVANLSNGKRQGLFRAMVFICCGLSIYSNHLVEAVGKVLPIPRNRFIAGSFMASIVVAFVALTGYIAFARNQGHFQRDTITEIVAYQEFPLINFEEQCAQAGFGPYHYDLLYSFQRWIPYKLIEATGIAKMEHPMHPIPSSPAGLYEDIQWSLGLPGVIAFSFLIGAAMQWLYQSALKHLVCMLIYCQCAFALLVAHSFNEFLILNYDPAPYVCFYILVACLPIPKRRAALVNDLPSTGRLSWG
jgi:oligosaccharide repeat unit polymerase